MGKEMEKGAGDGEEKNGRNREKKVVVAKKKDGKDKRAVAKPGAMMRSVRISAERDVRRARNPNAPVDRPESDLAPKVVAVVGPRQSGKSTVIRSLVRHWTKRKIVDTHGPMTMVTGRKRRLTLLEVSDDLPSIIDAAKVADLILCVIDAHFGFEMETFEVLNIAATHGMPRVIGVLTNLDKFRDGKQVRNVKKRIKSRFWTELYDGAKLFYFSGLTTHEDYLSREVLNLARFISVTKYRPIRWRTEHPYVLADRVEDVSDPTLDPTANRTVATFGYVRGTNLRVNNGRWFIHVAGLGDLHARRVDVLPDPCPPAEGGYDHPAAPKKKKRLGDRERILYAPMAGNMDGIIYDKDAVYITLPDQAVRFTKEDGEGSDDDEDDEEQLEEGVQMVRDLQQVRIGIDENIESKRMQMLSDGAAMTSSTFGEKRRRKVRFEDESEEEKDAKSSDDDQSEDGEDSEEEEGEEIERDDDDDDENNDNDDYENGGNDYDENEEDVGEDVEAKAALRWKEMRMERVSKRLASESHSLARYIYGNAVEGREDVDDDKDDVDNNDGELFEKKNASGQDDVSLDASRLGSPVTNWEEDEEACAELRLRRFATGSRESKALANGVGSDEEQVFGDFEDLETGEKFGGRREEMDGEDSGGEDCGEELTKKREETKRRFDAEYENRKGQNEDDDEVKRETDGDWNAGIEEERKRLEERRKEELEKMDETTRREIEGILPGR